MVDWVESGVRSFQASAALAVYRRVKLDASGKLTYAGAADQNAIGVTMRAAFAADEWVPVRLLTADGTMPYTAAGAIAVTDSLYAAANGKVASTGTVLAGLPLEAVAGDGDFLEAVVSNLVNFGGTANAVPTIDDDTGGTNGGTEQLTWTAVTASAIDDDAGGTNGGTEQLTAMRFTAGTAGFLTPIKNNFAVLADELNELRLNVVNMETKVKNNFAVLADGINAIIAALKGAGLMSS